MALFKKKSADAQVAAAPTASDAVAPNASDVSTALDDFSDFAPDAAPSADDTTPASNGKRAKSVKADKKASSGRVLKNGVYIGLNIGSDSIKVAELTAKAGALSLTGMGIVPTPPESISNGVVMSVNALANAIRDALIQAGIKSKKVVTSVAGTGALVVRIIEVPKMSDGELEDNMKMDADRYIPFPPSEVIMDFKALRDLPTDPDAMNMEVLLAAAQREIVDLHVQVLQDAKLDPRAIDVEPLAAARALTSSFLNGASMGAEADYSDVGAILNIGASGTEISILRGDLLVFTRTVPTGGAMLTQALVDTLGLAWHDAEELKCDMGDALQPHATSTSAAASVQGFDPTGDGSDNDWSDFGTAYEAGGETVSAGDLEVGGEAAPAISAVSSQGSYATDPFDDAFFEQGPQSPEPGEQHQQKQADEDDAEAKVLPSREGETSATEAVTGAHSTPDEDEGVLPSKDVPQPPVAVGNALPVAAQSEVPQGVSPDIAALFNFDDVAEPDEELPTADEERPLDFNNLLGEEEDFTDLPTLASDAPAAAPLASAFDFPTAAVGTVGGSAQNGGVEFDESSDAELPGRVAGAAASAPESIFGSTAIDAAEASLLPTESAEVMPDVTTTNPFSFVQEAEEPKAAPVSGFSFDLDAPSEPIEAPSTSPAAVDPFAAFDLAGSATGAPVTTGTSVVDSTTAAASEAADDFDLDTLFAAAPAGEAIAPVAVGASETAAFDALGDDFGDDLSSFGAGLTGATAGEIDAQALYSVIHPVLENLVAEVRRSLEYHTTRYPDAAVRRITLIGGGAKLKNLDAYFTQSLGIPTSIGNAAASLPLNAPKLSSDFVEENGTRFTVAIGLALRELVR